MLSGQMELILPADMDYAMAAGLAADGVGMKAGLEMDLLADLRTLCTECMDTLLHQFYFPEKIRMTIQLQNRRLELCYQALNRSPSRANENVLSEEMTKAILETLVPQVCFETDDGGIHQISCSMPI